MNDDAIFSILRMKINPSTKLGLIALVMNDEDAMTTRELNNTLNCSKTYQNYQVLFQEEIKSGIISIVPMKSKNGIIRNHFVVDRNKLVEE